jgi:hypothetical protein
MYGARLAHLCTWVAEMAITTLAGVVAGLQPPEYIGKTNVAGEATGMYVSMFYAGGRPPAAAAPSPGLDGEALTSYTNQIPFTNPASGNAYLAGLYSGAANGASSGQWLLCDRLWHNSGINPTTTTEQAITSPTWPARDRGGSTNGDGVFIGLEVSSLIGNSTTALTTLNYTNSSGTAGRTGTLPIAGVTLASNTFMFFALQSGDTGVRSVQGITLGENMTGGTMHLVALRPLMLLPFWGAPAPQDFFADAIACGFPRLYNNTVPFLMAVGTSTSAPDTPMTIQYAHG